MPYGDSNGHMTYDVTWPERSSCDPSTLRAPISQKQLEMHKMDLKIE